MKILSRYFIFRFLGYVGLATLAFFGLVLATRFHEVARFAALGAPLDQIGLLLLLQFPYVFPFVLPVAILLASFLLMRQASDGFELVSLRASGLSLFRIQQPILMTALCFSFLNFWLVSDVATYCHQKARFLEREFREVNPMVFLKKPELLGIPGLEVVTLGEVHPGRSATRNLIAMPDLKKGRMSLLLADSLVREGSDVVGHDVLFFTSVDTKSLPDIFVDKAEEMRLNGETFFSLFKKEPGKISIDFLPTPLLVYRLMESGYNPKFLSEGLRRLSMALEPFTLAILGLSFGVYFGRHKPIVSVFLMLLLLALSLITLFLGKSFDKSVAASVLIYIVPHPFIWFCSFLKWRTL